VRNVFLFCCFTGLAFSDVKTVTKDNLMSIDGVTWLYKRRVKTDVESRIPLSVVPARHTFATTVTIANNMSIESVSKMLGHTTIKMTKKYARIADKLISVDMQKLEGKYYFEIAGDPRE